MRYRIIHLDTCYSSYFQGFGGPTDCMMVDGDTRAHEVAQWLRDTAFDDGCDYDYAALAEAVEEFIKDNKLDTYPNAIMFDFLDIPEEGEEWDCYAYFGLEEINED